MDTRAGNSVGRRFTLIITSCTKTSTNTAAQHTHVTNCRTAAFHFFGWRVPVRTAATSRPIDTASPRAGASMNTQKRFATRQKKNPLCALKKRENGA